MKFNGIVGHFILNVEAPNPKLRKASTCRIDCRKALIAVLIFAILLASSLSIQPAAAATPPDLDVSTSTQTLSAGTTNSVSFTMTNNGGTEADNITISISVAGLPMILSGSDGNYFIQSLIPGQSNTIAVPIFVSPSAAGGVYQITFTIAYDQKATPVTRTIGVSVPIPPSSVQLVTDVSPSTLQIGIVNQVNFTISNTGTSNITSLQAVLTLPQASTAGAPFTLENSDGKYFIGNLTAGQSVNLTANVFVSPSAAGAIYPFSLTITYYDNYGIARQETRTLNLNVPQVLGPVINMTLSSNGLVSGVVNYINLTVQNMGNRPADALVVQITLPGSATGTSTAILEGSNGIWTFNTLNPGDVQVIPLQIFVSPSISGTLLSFTVSSSYSDAGYKAQQQTNNFGMIVRGNINLVILGTSTFPTTVVAGQPFSLTVNFINLGTATAQSVVLTPNGTDMLQPTSNTNIFLGDLAINVPSSFSISFNTTSGVTAGQYSVSLPYTYKDPLGNSYSSVLNIAFSLSVTTNSTSGGSTGQTRGSFLIDLLIAILIIVVIAVVVLFWIRRRRSRAVQ